MKIDSHLPKFPRLPKNVHKNQRGHALIIAGSKEKSGAAVLSSLACARAGTGLTTLAIASAAHDIVKGQLVDVMSEQIPSDSSSRFNKDSLEVISAFIKNKTAVLVGPGLTPDSNRKEWLTQLLQMTTSPVVVDAQALSDLGSDGPPPNIIITPHTGEMSKLTGLSSEEITNNRSEIAKQYAQTWNATVVLKGQHTLVAFPDGQLWENQVDHPCLSVAGSGDVLAGIMISLLAQKMSIQDACKMAVYIHGRAGQRLGERTGIRGVLASDLLNEIPQVIHEIDSNPTA